MKLTGTARGENLRFLIEDAEAQVKAFYGNETKCTLQMTEAVAEQEVDTWGDKTERTVFAAGFIATPTEDTE